MKSFLTYITYFWLTFLCAPACLYAQNVPTNTNEARLEAILLNSGVFVVFVVLFMGLIIFFRNRTQNSQFKKQNDTMRSQAREIVKSNTEFMKLKTHTDEVEHQKNSIIGIMSNDLKKPFNRIISLVDLIRLEGIEKLNANQVEYLSKMSQVVQDGLIIIQNLLDSKVIEDYKKEIQIERLNIITTIQQAIKRHKGYAQTKNINIEFIPSKSKIEYRTDEFFLTRITENLISNAIKFSPEGKKINVKLQDNEENVRLEVKDEGLGICVEDQAKLFIQHQTFKNRATAGESSSGLGLSVVKSLVDELNGKIWCESIEGKGATFILELPKNVIKYY